MEYKLLTGLIVIFGAKTHQQRLKRSSCLAKKPILLQIFREILFGYFGVKCKSITHFPGENYLTKNE